MAFRHDDSKYSMAIIMISLKCIGKRVQIQGSNQEHSYKSKAPFGVLFFACKSCIKEGRGILCVVTERDEPMRISISEALEKGIIKPSDAAKMRADITRKEKTKTPQKGKKRSNNRDIEGAEQAELIALFNEQYPDYAGLLIHIPMGGSRANKFEGWRLKQQGARKGVSDLLLVVKRHGFGALWIEFKADSPNTATITHDQRIWLEDVFKEEHAGLIAIGVTSALNVITAYLTGTRTEFINAVASADSFAPLLQKEK